MCIKDSGKTIHSAEKNDASYKRAAFFTEMKEKKFKMADIENSKWPTQKKNSFSSSDKSQYFFMKSSWIGPWVSRID